MKTTLNRWFKRTAPFVITKRDLELLVTLWPSLPYFRQFAYDDRLAGIRLNSAMINNVDLIKELALLREYAPSVPVWFDVKGHQLRVTWVDKANQKFLDCRLNHAINGIVPPVNVLFKAEKDYGVLERIEEDGQRLIFRPGKPYYAVEPGESIHIRHPALRITGPDFTDVEKEKIAQVAKFGCQRYFLSYVYSQRYVDEFTELVGKDAELWLKIENQAGLRYVEREFKKQPNRILVAARGDLYVEVPMPHQILKALKLIIDKDPDACVASRLLLSLVNTPVPDCVDFCELAWLYDIGYRRMMLCDDLCLKPELLSTAVNAFAAFRQSYAA